jgi:hypothetical protein
LAALGAAGAFANMGAPAVSLRTKVQFG